jgi:hypothetical protein
MLFMRLDLASNIIFFTPNIIFFCETT